MHKPVNLVLMNDKPYQNWHAYSDQALAAHIGTFVKHHRLQQNKTQETLSHAAGISRSTLSLLERGQTVTVATLIQVLRVLDQLHVMETFQVPKLISPLALAKAERAMKKRARGRKTEGEGEYSW
jgi:transcriptional regulator with XRE-family HTH domain